MAVPQPIRDEVSAHYQTVPHALPHAGGTVFEQVAMGHGLRLHDFVSCNRICGMRSFATHRLPRTTQEGNRSAARGTKSQMHKSRIWSWWATTATAPDPEQSTTALQLDEGARTAHVVAEQGNSRFYDEGRVLRVFRGEVVPENGELDSLWQ